MCLRVGESMYAIGVSEIVSAHDFVAGGGIRRIDPGLSSEIDQFICVLLQVFVHEGQVISCICSMRCEKSQRATKECDLRTNTPDERRVRLLMRFEAKQKDTDPSLGFRVIVKVCGNFL